MQTITISQEAYILLNLSLFGEGGDGAGDAGTGVTGQDAAADTGVNGQTPAAEAEQIDYAAQFDEDIKGKYKDAYGKSVSKAVKERLKNVKPAADKWAKAERAFRFLSEQYGIDANDIDGISDKLMDDNAFYQAEAFKNGVTIEQQKKISRYDAIEAEQAKRDAFEAKYNGWKSQEEAVKMKFPGFNFDEEFASNREFIAQLDAGVPVESAYISCHWEDLMSGALQYATVQAQQKVANAVQANSKRPSENGTSSASTATSKTDVSKMTAAQMEDLYQRALRGERITLK